MSKSRFVLDKFAKLLEEGFVNYKDISNEILNVLRSKRDEIVFKMKLASKEETDVIKKRLEKLEKKVEHLEKKNPKKTKKATKP